MAATGLSPEGLLQAAEYLVPEGRGRPPAARLRRAISTVYYAAFKTRLRLLTERSLHWNRHASSVLNNSTSLASQRLPTSEAVDIC